MGKSGTDSAVILGCVAGLFAIGVLCLVWPRGMQRASIWWADLGMYPFPGLARSPYFVWVLRLLGLFLVGLTAFLLSGVIGSFFG
jgi:hypothetical protein